jgi:hypothetical protein
MTLICYKKDVICYKKDVDLLQKRRDSATEQPFQQPICYKKDVFTSWSLALTKKLLSIMLS